MFHVSCPIYVVFFSLFTVCVLFTGCKYSYYAWNKKNIAVCDVCNVAQNVFEILVYVYSKLQHNLSLLFSWYTIFCEFYES